MGMVSGPGLFRFSRVLEANISVSLVAGFDPSSNNQKDPDKATTRISSERMQGSPKKEARRVPPWGTICTLSTALENFEI